MRTQLTVTGNLTNHPTSRHTKDGLRLVEFGLAYNNRRMDRGTGLWEDGEPTFFTVTCWRRLADGVLASLHKGDPVVVHGRLTTREYERGDGLVRSELKIDAQAVGPDLGRAIAAVTRTPPRQVPASEPDGSPETVPPPVGPEPAELDDEFGPEEPEEADRVLSLVAPGDGD